jgi:hypothetical protein
MSAPIALSRPKHSALAFDGKDVTEFLEDFNRQTDNSGLSDQQKVMVLPDYLDDPDRSLMRILKRLPGYGTKNWPALQDSMQEQWKDQDTTLLLGKRSYLQTYIAECIHHWPGLTEYYMQFSASADACIAARQIPEEEKGILFFKGLPKKDKEAVMFLYAAAPKADVWDSYDCDAIYQWLREHHKKRDGIEDMHRQLRGENDPETRMMMLSNKKPKFSSEDVVKAAQTIRESQETRTESRPQEVDAEVDDLIKSMNGLQINLATVELLMAIPATKELLSKASNYAYFITRATTGGMTSERNDGSYITGAPRNMSATQGTGVYRGREYRNTCNMCNEPGHRGRECPHYNHLMELGWISFHWDADTRTKTYYFGPRHDQLDAIIDREPGHLQLQWLKSKIKEYFNVTDDVLNQPAHVVCPDKFQGSAQRPPAAWQRARTEGPPDLRTQGSANILTNNERGPYRPDAIKDYQRFQERMLEPGSIDDYTILDSIDAESIILPGTIQEVNTAELNSKTRSGSEPPKRKSSLRGIEKVRGGYVKKSRPNSITIEPDARGEYPTVRGQDQPYEDERAREETTNQDALDDWAEDSYARRVHEDPFSIIEPPASWVPGENLSADPNDLHNSKKKKAVKFSAALPDSELRELSRSHPNRIATAMLGQEIRGVTMSDLLSQNNIRKQLRELLDEEDTDYGGSGSVNMACVGGATNPGCSAGTRRLLSRPAARDPPIDAQRFTAPGTSTIPINATDDRTNLPNDARTHALRDDGHIHLVGAQVRHEINGRGDSWMADLDALPSKAVQSSHRRAGTASLVSDLPECWTTVNGVPVKCLIDTGAQMNILRLSAANALKLPFELLEQKLGEPPQGVTSANGGHEAFVGTAWSVPVRIGSVVIRTHFRIVANITRSAILGGPWCALARIAIQYNALGRITCRILSPDGSRNAVFIASDPVPGHHSQVVAHDEDDDSENE